MRRTINIVPPSMYELFYAHFCKDLAEDLSTTAKQKWDAFLCPFHQLVDEALAANFGRFANFVYEDNTTDAWMLWSTLVEKCAVNFLGLSGPTAKAQCGRGSPHFVRQTHQGDLRFLGSDLDGFELCIHLKRARKLHLILQQLQQWTARLRIVSKPDVPMGKLLGLLQLNLDSKRLILKAISDAALPDKALHDLIKDCQPNDSKLLFPLLRHALLIQKLHTAETSRARRANTDDAKEAFTNDLRPV